MFDLDSQGRWNRFKVRGGKSKKIIFNLKTLIFSFVAWFKPTNFLFLSYPNVYKFNASGLSTKVGSVSFSFCGETCWSWTINALAIFPYLNGNEYNLVI